MSGFVALRNTDGAAVAPRLIGNLTEQMAYRGPDGQSTRCDGPVGLGHAALRTLQGPAEAPQPLTLDGKTWIVADARIDDRETLVRQLAGAGRTVAESEPDATLILHAYAAWGKRAAEKLLGDFAFAIWDAAEKTLFCARDHIGVKPFYYARTGSMLVVGNTIASLRGHPEISGGLDEHAIADYLLFGLNRYPERTSFAQIQRLPAAHTLVCSASGSLSIERYWRLHVTGHLVYRRDDDYVDRYGELLRAATADRLRNSRSTVLMSGGLDSTSVAAVAAEVASTRGDDCRLAGCTLRYTDLIEDPEPDFARRAAAAIGIPLHEVALDADRAADWWGPSAAWNAEPNPMPASARIIELVSRTNPGTRVGFTGQGGDPALHITPADAAHRARKDGWLATALAMLRYRRSHGHLPRVGLRTYARRRFRGRRYEYDPVFPPWIRPQLVERLDLQDRYRTLLDKDLDADATRPEAELQLAGPEWSFFLETYDAGQNGLHAEYRHPLLDVRLLEFSLALPVFPWLVEKEILRRTMRGRLPDALLSRRKAPMHANPVHEALSRGVGATLGLASDNPTLAEFVDIERFLRIARHPERLRPSECELVTRPLGLALWLSRLQTGKPRATENSGERGQHDAAEEAVPQA